MKESFFSFPEKNVVCIYKDPRKFVHVKNLSLGHPRKYVHTKIYFPKVGKDSS